MHSFGILTLQIFALTLSLVWAFAHFTWSGLAIAVCVYALMGGVGGTVTYHRLLTHRSFKAPWWFEQLGTYLGMLSGSGSSLAWVAIHRAHHRYSDTPQDPHSPMYKGWWWVQFLSMRAKADPIYIKDLMRQKFHVEMHIMYFPIVLGYVAATGITMDGWNWWKCAEWWALPATMTWHLQSLVNSIGHDYLPRDKPWLAMLTFGEGHHEHHHRAPTDPRLGKFDLGYQLIKQVRTDA